MNLPPTETPDFGVRSVPPCADCDERGYCTMNCSAPGDPLGAASYEPCKECVDLTYVIREFGEIACPECQPDAYEEQLRDTWLGY